ncbi:prephenate dehydrogenase [Wenyingzhuangia fucanilytica]|uniref:Prephenate dehydrogenase n=1 Tax=Wenyingzhuangia fucanilytica TaxID=1790137 RepID=A0A1B1Y2I6_9FLAO|nr:prephenate dehydrogenase [Wenyingzhuangia fucanilytica]ANW94983.1 prephenate dehydrogenase [Wenyingzhuangia fucanilytica]
MLVTVIGLGLIGGSLALELKKRLGYTVHGIDANVANAQKALALGIIDKIVDFNQIADSDVVVLAVPVNFLPDLAINVLDTVKKDTIVFDMGSTKEKLSKTVENHEKRTNFVAVHPIAGTEHSGPEAAIYHLFDDKVNIICDKELSSEVAVTKVLDIFNALNMRTIFMNSAEHDKHIAYVSHLSHISSFMLGKTVLEKEKNEKNIFDMAGSGFESTVRLAKSSPNMWTPIFIENKENILSSLNEYIDNLTAFKNLIIEEDKKGLQQTMLETNHIKEVLTGIQK